MPVPSTCTPRPAPPACSIAFRTVCPTNEGTATFYPAFTITDPLTTGAGGRLAGIGRVGSGASAGLGVIVSANTVVEEGGCDGDCPVLAPISTGAAIFATGAACSGFCCGL